MTTSGANSQANNGTSKGRLKNISFEPVASDQGVYQISSKYVLRMTLANSFELGMRLVLEFSSDAVGYQPISDAACIVKSSIIEVADAYICQIESSKKSLTIENFTKQTIESGTVLELELGALRVRNPASIRYSSTVSVSTVSGDIVIDSGTSVPFSPTPSRLLLAQINPSSLMSNEQDVEYTVTIQPSGPIP